MSLTTTQQHFTKFYLAAFLRAPDLGGLNYWANEVQSGKSLQEVGGVIFSLPIVTDIYPSNLSDHAFVEAIYHNVFGRNSDAEGLNYWSNEIATLRNSLIAQGHDAAFAAYEARGQLTINMINAGLGTPDGTDGKAYIENRLEVAEYAAEQQLAQGEEIAVAFLLETFRKVNADVSSVTEGKSAVVSFLADETAPTAQLTPIIVHAPVQLEASGVTNGYDGTPQVSALGSSGAYVVTWYGLDSAGDYSIFVQQFNADGSITDHAPVQLEAIGVTNGIDYNPQVSAIGSSGAYVVAWQSKDSAGDFSIFVQQFNADGSTTGHTPVQLEAIGVTDGGDYDPQVSAIGSSGAYVVTWYGRDSEGFDDSVFVQQFNADGSTTGHAPVMLETMTVGYDDAPQVSAIGSSGAYVVTWEGNDDGDTSVFVQQFNADGSTTGHAPVMLEAIGVTYGGDYDTQVSAIGSSGAYVVTWFGDDSDGIYGSFFVQQFNADGSIMGHAPVQLGPIGMTHFYGDSAQVSAIGSNGAYVVTWEGRESVRDDFDHSIFVQQFNADGSTTGHAPVQLEAIGMKFGDDESPQVSAIGSSGAYVVTWYGRESVSDGFDHSIFVQQFNADGSTTGHAPVRLEAIGVTDGEDYDPQVSAIGSSGAYVVTWEGRESVRDGFDFSIFVQQFNADGSLHSGVQAQSSEPGTAYLVRDSVAVSDKASILAAADNLWNVVELTIANTDTYLTDAGLASGSYHLYTVDLAGNLSQQSVDSYTML